MAAADRRRREAAGRRAEALAVWFLRLRGYRVLARRYRVPVGEIDIVAARGRVVAFIEVKARQSVATALQSLTARQRRRIVRAAKSFLQTRPDLENRLFRFDLVLIAPWKLPRHLVDAWREE